MDPSRLRLALAGWSATIRDGGGEPAPYHLAAEGPELRPEVQSAHGGRPVRGRLSAFVLLAGRYWAAAELDPEAYPLRVGAYPARCFARPARHRHGDRACGGEHYHHTCNRGGSQLE